jgi:hypothetical protein
MKHTPKIHACHWMVDFKNGQEVGTCRICKAVRVFDSERTRVESLRRNAVLRP